MLRTSQMLSREVPESMDTVLLGEEFVRYCEAHGIVHEKPRRRGAHRMDVDVSHRRNGQTAPRVAPTHAKASATLTAKNQKSDTVVAMIAGHHVESNDGSDKSRGRRLE